MLHLVVGEKRTADNLIAGATCWLYLIAAGGALVHDVVEVHQEITVGEHILVPGHHLTDELVGLQLASLVLCWQHGGLWRREREAEVSIIMRS